MEEIYRRPGWGQLLGVAQDNGYHNGDTTVFRKKLAAMKKEDLAEVLATLDAT